MSAEHRLTTIGRYRPKVLATVREMAERGDTTADITFWLNAKGYRITRDSVKRWLDANVKDEAAS